MLRAWFDTTSASSYPVFVHALLWEIVLAAAGLSGSSPPLTLCTALPTRPRHRQRLWGYFYGCNNETLRLRETVPLTVHYR